MFCFCNGATNPAAQALAAGDHIALPNYQIAELPNCALTFAPELKRLTSILLLCVFAYSIVGLHILGCIVANGLKEGWHHRLEDGELVKLEFAKGEKINWVDKYEVLMNGIMYDVEETETIDGKTILYAYADHEEVQTLKTIAGLNKESEKKEGLGVLSLEFCSGFVTLNLFQGLYSLNYIYTFERNDKLPSSFLKKDSPPPELG